MWSVRDGKLITQSAKSVLYQGINRDLKTFEKYPINWIYNNNNIIIKSLFQAMPIKVRCTIAQKSAQIVGARVHVCIITKLAAESAVADEPV